MVIKGAWGVGKTHAWKQLVLENKNNIQLPYYSYVSLFGLSTIAEMRAAIFTKTQSVKRLGVTLDFDTINHDWTGLFWEKGKNTIHRFKDLFKEVPIAKHLTVGIEVLAQHLVGDSIVLSR